MGFHSISWDVFGILLSYTWLDMYMKEIPLEQGEGSTEANCKIWLDSSTTGRWLGGVEGSLGHVNERELL